MATRAQQLAAWLIHLFTASGAIFGLFAMYAINQNDYVLALWLMALCIVIDAVDGTFARKVGVSKVLPQVDGCLLDNMVDYFNYVLVPAYFMLVVPWLLPKGFQGLCACLIALASAYQFTQRDAKTADHFFKGFPSYWNILVFYLFVWGTHSITNLIIVLAFVVLSFIPIKYIYPSRLEHLSSKKSIRATIALSTYIWGLATVGLLFHYPKGNTLLTGVCFVYIIAYFCMSLYRTFKPLTP